MAREKRESFTLQKCPRTTDRSILKIWRKIFFFRERTSYRLNLQIISSRSEDIIFFSSNCDTTKVDKHIKVVTVASPALNGKKKTFSLQKYLNRFDLQIT